MAGDTVKASLPGSVDGNGKPKMKRVLGVLDITMFGIACITGAGIFVLTGRVAHKFTGPSIVASFAIGGLVSFITAIVYCEFGSEVSVTGGSYVYVAQVFGTPIAWLIGVSILFEYVFTAAAVAKGFTSYLMVVASKPISTVRFHIAGSGDAEWTADPLALSIVMLFSLLLIFNVKGSSWANTVITGLALVVMAFTIITGFVYIKPENYSPFAPFGIKGVITGASKIFFAYVGYDMISLCAEEAGNPKVQIPAGVGLATIICTIIYLLMSAVMAGLVPYQNIKIDAPYGEAFKELGLDWAKIIIAVGALSAITDTILTNLYAMARLLVVMGRFRIIPSALAKVHPRLQTPVIGQIVTMIVTGLLSTFFPLDQLADIVSMGTLIAIYAVCLACIWRRYYVPGGKTKNTELYVPFTGIFLSQVIIAFTYELSDAKYWGVFVAFGLIWVASTGYLHRFPIQFEPSAFKTPLFPWLPSFGAGSCMLLIATLGRETWKSWGYATLAFFGLWLALKVYEYFVHGLSPGHWFDPDASVEEDYDLILPRIKYIQADVPESSTLSEHPTTLKTYADA